MEEKQNHVAKSDKVFKIVIACAVIITAGVGGLWFWWKQQPEPVVETPAQKEAPPVTQDASEKQKTLPESHVIDYGKLMDKDAETKDLMEKRKEAYGVDKGVDMVVTSDESIKIADSTVPMQEILDKIRLKEGGLVEKDLGGQAGTTDPTISGDTKGTDAKNTLSVQKNDDVQRNFKISLGSDDNVGVYGIYVVQWGDNIWNIHFEFLRNYFQKKGISLSPRADEPNVLGRSSGVGKLLKFSEKMVHIYNIREKELSADLNLIHPLNKIVVFNLGRAFSLLDQIDYKNVNHIQFDGETLWVPAEQ